MKVSNGNAISQWIWSLSQTAVFNSGTFIKVLIGDVKKNSGNASVARSGYRELWMTSAHNINRASLKLKICEKGIMSKAILAAHSKAEKSY
jgi:hypothetical protein